MSYLFHGQRTNEGVVLIAKQHPLVLLHPFLVSTLIWLIPLLVYVVSSSNSLLSIVVVVSFLLGLVHGGLAWYSWNNSILLLTNERIVQLQQKGILHREFSEIGLSSIQQVSHEVKGLIHTLFSFGSIVIYAGGSQTPFTVPSVPDPYDIQQEILRCAAGEGFVEAEEEDQEEEES